MLLENDTYCLILMDTSRQMSKSHRKVCTNYESIMVVIVQGSS